MRVRLGVCKPGLSHSNFILLVVPRQYFCYMYHSICFMFWSRIFALFEPYVRFQFWWLSGRPIAEKSCSLALRYVFIVLVPNCQFSFFSTSFFFFFFFFFFSGNFFRIAPFPDHCLHCLHIPFFFAKTHILTDLKKQHLHCRFFLSEYTRTGGGGLLNVMNHCRS